MVALSPEQYSSHVTLQLVMEVMQLPFVSAGTHSRAALDQGGEGVAVTLAVVASDTDGRTVVDADMDGLNVLEECPGTKENRDSAVAFPYNHSAATCMRVSAVS